ncbi:MAG: UDP-N-acetylmuramoyl-L-alanine--D-glutamate ligase [Planctomycetota bacterium]|nr:UDP-N-acetylmuramoyl-L-alanine--D-glutamate ligase [Planctomycetota bacterium]
MTTEEITDLKFGSPDRNPDQLEGLRVLVVGLGRHDGGTDLVRFLADRGAVVSITDPADHDQLKSSLDRVADLPLHRVRIGEPHHRQDLLDCDWVVVNPAIPPGTPFLGEIARSSVLAVTELGMAISWLPRQHLAAITGTHGKSTTCQLACQMLRASGLGAIAGGNLGGSLLSQIDDGQSSEVRYIVEVSSFQAERLDEKADRPAIVAITNLSDDHLDWHGSRKKYRDAKLRLLDNPGRGDAIAILPTTGPLGRDYHCNTRTVIRCGLDGTAGESRPGSGTLQIITTDRDELTIPFSAPSPLEGSAGLENSLQAATIAAALGATEEGISRAIDNYVGLPHRYQEVGEVRGVRYIDDSKATTPEAVASAIHRSNCTLHWLCGGKPKSGEIDIRPLLEPLSGRKCHAYCFGGLAENWQDALRSAPLSHLEGHRSLAAAFEAVAAKAATGEMVLLSPGGSSFDQYPSAEERGLEFQRLVSGMGPSLTASAGDR